MAAFTDLSEHTGTLIAIISTLLVIAGVLIGAIWMVVSKLAMNLKTDILKMLSDYGHRLESHIDQSNLYALKSDIEPKFTEIFSRQDYLRTSILPTFQRKEDMNTWGKIMEQGFKDLGERVAAISQRLDKSLDNHK